MLIGDPATFATSVKISVGPKDKWLFGQFCYVINGELVGNFEEITSLADVLSAVTPIVKDNGKRENCELFHLDMETIYRRVSLCVYDDHSDHDGLLGEMPARLDITPRVSIFRHCRILLVDCGLSANIIFTRNLRDLYRHDAASGTFDQVIYSTFEYLTNELNRY